MSSGTKPTVKDDKGGQKIEEMPSPYTPIDQSVFEHQTGEAESRIEQRRREKLELQRQQHIINTIAAIVAGLIVVGVIVAVVINTLK